MLQKVMEYCNIYTIKNYMGTGWILPIYIVAMIYLFITEKKRSTRLLLVFTGIVQAVFFLCPLCFWVYGKVMEPATYYRFLWIMPMGIVICYAFTNLFLHHRWIGLIVGCCIFVVAGSYVYKGQYISEAENEYHLPQEMVEICDKIHPQYYDVTACFPMEYIHQVRQYDAGITLSFGREVLVSGWGGKNPVYTAYTAEQIDSANLVSACTEEEVKYVVLAKDRQIDCDLQEYGWKIYYETQHYFVYENTAVSTTWEKVCDWILTIPKDQAVQWLEKEKIDASYESIVNQ